MRTGGAHRKCPLCQNDPGCLLTWLQSIRRCVFLASLGVRGVRGVRGVSGVREHRRRARRKRFVSMRGFVLFLWLGHEKNGRAIAWLGYCAAVLLLVLLLLLLLCCCWCCFGEVDLWRCFLLPRLVMGGNGAGWPSESKKTQSPFGPA